MRFVLRCIICLAIVYAAILRHDGYLVDPARLVEAASAVPRRAGETIAAAAGPAITARVEAYCRDEPAACLVEAAALARPLGAGAAAEVAPQRRFRGALGAARP